MAGDIDPDIISQVMRELGRRGGEKRVKKGFATMTPQRRKEISAKAVAAKAGKRLATYNPHYDFLKTEEDFAETMLGAFDMMREYYPEGSAQALAKVENALATVRRLLNPEWLSEEQLASIEERFTRLQAGVGSRKELESGRCVFEASRPRGRLSD